MRWMEVVVLGTNRFKIFISIDLKVKVDLSINERNHPGGNIESVISRNREP